MPFSTACNTPLSNFESGQNYKEVQDPSGKHVIKFERFLHVLKFSSFFVISFITCDYS